MVDWRGSSLQIVIALIGSSLVLTALTSLSSFINKPVLNIDDPKVTDYPSYHHKDNSTTYKISVKNIGTSPAKDIRLTMTYPDANVISITAIHTDENINLTKETPNSAVAFLPRLSEGIVITVETNITGIVNPLFHNPLDDFTNNQSAYAYEHEDPFSITVTHDQGSNKYVQSSKSTIDDIIESFFNIEFLKFYIPIVLAILLFGIAFRHSRKSQSKSASNILKDIMKVEKKLKDADSRAILSFSKNGSNDDKPPIFDNYDDYDLVHDFYTGINQRNSKISEAYLPSGTDNINNVLKEQNKKCLSLAMSARSNIKWEKFYRFDFILLLPAITLGSAFITIVCQGLPIILIVPSFLEQAEQHPYLNLIYVIIAVTLVRSIATYFIMRWILYVAQGFTISKYVVRPLSQPIRFFGYCAGIMGFPSFTILLITSSIVPNTSILTLVIEILIDICRMFILTVVVSRSLGTRKKKVNILKKETQ